MLISFGCQTPLYIFPPLLIFCHRWAGYQLLSLQIQTSIELFILLFITSLWIIINTLRRIWIRAKTSVRNFICFCRIYKKINSLCVIRCLNDKLQLPVYVYCVCTFIIHWRITHSPAVHVIQICTRILWILWTWVWFINVSIPRMCVCLQALIHPND